MYVLRMAAAGAFLGLLVVSGGLYAAETMEATANIDNFTFPEMITVTAGTKVTWTNHDDIPHTVTDAAQPRAYKSVALDSGDSFSHVFAMPGTYRYFCSLHPNMQGTVVVK